MIKKKQITTIEASQTIESFDPRIVSGFQSYQSSEQDKVFCPESVVKEFFNKGSGDLGKFLMSQGYLNKIKGCTFKDLCINKTILEGVDFEDCTFKESLLKTAKISRVHFTSCTFINSCIASGIMEKVKFEKCQLSSSDFYHSSLREVTFIDSTLPNSSFTDSQLRKTKFISSQLAGTSFLGASVTQSEIDSSDITDTLFTGCEKEFVINQCKRSLNKKPVIALGWNFTDPMNMASLCELVYKVKNVSLLRYPNSHPQVNNKHLQKEIEAGYKKISQNASDTSKVESLIREGISGAEYEKIKERVKKIVENCDGLNLPGGEDINEVFYKATDQINSDLRRDLLELCLLEEWEQSKKPAIGQCRALQILNVKKGGTLKTLGQSQGWIGKQLQLKVRPSQKSHLLKRLSDTIFAISMHNQAIDKLGKDLYVLVWDDGIPKIIANEKESFLFTQFHPETYIIETPELKRQIRHGFKCYLRHDFCEKVKGHNEQSMSTRRNTKKEKLDFLGNFFHSLQSLLPFAFLLHCLSHLSMASNRKVKTQKKPSLLSNKIDCIRSLLNKENEKFFTTFLDRVKEDIEKRRKSA